MWLQRGGGIAEESCTGAVRGTPAATCWDTKQEGGRECGVRCAGGGGGGAWEAQQRVSPAPTRRLVRPAGSACTLRRGRTPGAHLPQRAQLFPHLVHPAGRQVVVIWHHCVTVLSALARQNLQTVTTG